MLLPGAWCPLPSRRSQGEGSHHEDHSSGLTTVGGHSTRHVTRGRLEGLAVNSFLHEILHQLSPTVDAEGANEGIAVQSMPDVDGAIRKLDPRVPLHDVLPRDGREEPPCLLDAGDRLIEVCERHESARHVGVGKVQSQDDGQCDDKEPADEHTADVTRLDSFLHMRHPNIRRESSTVLKALRPETSTSDLLPLLLEFNGCGLVLYEAHILNRHRIVRHLHN